jgi:hypothetical protein
MKKHLISALAASVLIAVTSTAQAAQPLVVLSLTSANDVVGDVAELTEVAKVKELPTWLASMLRLYAEGNDLSGLDRSQPWGAVAQFDSDGISGFGFVPVTDAEQLSWGLDAEIRRVEDVGGGVIKVIGTEAGKELYATEAGGWLFVSDDESTLANLPADPAKLLGGLDKQYDVAVRFELKNIPEEEGSDLLSLLDEKLGSSIREHVSNDTYQLIGEAAKVVDDLTLGRTRH